MKSIFSEKYASRIKNSLSIILHNYIGYQFTIDTIQYIASDVKKEISSYIEVIDIESKYHDDRSVLEFDIKNTLEEEIKISLDFSNLSNITICIASNYDTVALEEVPYFDDISLAK